MAVVRRWQHSLSRLQERCILCFRRKPIMQYMGSSAGSKLEFCWRLERFACAGYRRALPVSYGKVRPCGRRLTRSSSLTARPDVLAPGCCSRLEPFTAPFGPEPFVAPLVLLALALAPLPLPLLWLALCMFLRCPAA